MYILRGVHYGGGLLYWVKLAGVEGKGAEGAGAGVNSSLPI